MCHRGQRWSRKSEEQTITETAREHPRPPSTTQQPQSPRVTSQNPRQRGGGAPEALCGLPQDEPHAVEREPRSAGWQQPWATLPHAQGGARRRPQGGLSAGKRPTAHTLAWKQGPHSGSFWKGHPEAEQSRCRGAGSWPGCMPRSCRASSLPTFHTLRLSLARPAVGSQSSGPHESMVAQ